MIKKTFLITLCLISINVYAYNRSQLKLTQNEFIKIVKPQMRNIFNDYQNLLFILNEDLKVYKKLFPVYQELLIEQNRLIEYCTIANNVECTKTLNIILKKSQVILSEITLPPNTSNKNKLVEITPLSSFQNFNKHKMNMFNYYLDLFNFHFLYRAEVKSPIKITSYQKKTIDIFYQFHHLIISLAPIEYQKRLKGFWSQFIRPISSKIMIQSDKNVFLNQINSLNITFNVFHSSMTKRNDNVDKRIKNNLTIMHTRWNNILKATLR